MSTRQDFLSCPASYLPHGGRQDRTKVKIASCSTVQDRAAGRQDVLSCANLWMGQYMNTVLFFFLNASVFTRNKVDYESPKPNFHWAKQILLIIYLKVNLLFAIFRYNKYTLTHHLFYKCDKLQKEHLQFTS